MIAAELGNGGETLAARQHSDDSQRQDGGQRVDRAARVARVRDRGQRLNQGQIAHEKALLGGRCHIPRMVIPIFSPSAKLKQRTALSSLGVPLDFGNGADVRGSGRRKEGRPMPTVTIECATEAEAASVRLAAAFAGEMHRLAHSAPDGQVLHLTEGLALDQGRSLLRDTLQAAVQERVDAAEQKGGRRAPARAGAASASRGGTSAT